MVSFTTIIAATTLATSVIAAPLAMVAASAIGGAVSGHKIRGETSLWNRDSDAFLYTRANPALQKQFKDCTDAMKTNKPTVKKVGRVVTISKMPTICITNIKTYNAGPNIKELQAKQGTAKIISADTVELHNMPAEIVDMLDG